MSHHVRMRAITEGLDPVGILRTVPRIFHQKYNLLFPFPGQGGDKPKLYFRGYGDPFLHLVIKLETQSAPTELRSRRQAIHKRTRSPKSPSGEPPAPNRILHGLE